MSQRLASRLLVFIAAFSFVALAHMGLAHAAGSAQQALLDIDAERAAAFQTADVGRIARLLSDDLTYVHTTGIIDGKPSLLGKIKSGDLTYQSVKTQDVVARPYGTAGIVTGTAELHVLSAHQPKVIMLRYTATYVLHDGRWQLVAYQSTPLPG